MMTDFFIFWVNYPVNLSMEPIFIFGSVTIHFAHMVESASKVAFELRCTC